MTDKEIKAKILAEIDGLKKHYLEREEYDLGYNKALKDIKSFINSLPEEPVSKDSEEAIKEYSEKERLRKAENESRLFSLTDFDRGFKAGAHWQKDKTISKAVEWLHRNVDSSMWLMNFKKYMEEQL